MNVLFTPSSPSVLSACWEQLETLFGDGAAEADFRLLPESTNRQKGALTKFNHRGRVTDTALMQRLMKANRAGCAVTAEVSAAQIEQAAALKDSQHDNTAKKALHR